MVETFLLIARIVLAAVFGVAGVAKLADRAGSRNSLTQFGVPAFAVPAGALLLPIAELACVAALLSSSWAVWGAAGAFALLLLFVIAIAVNMAQGRTPDCRCFGQLHSSPVGWSTIVRNLLLAALAAFVYWHGPPYAGPAEILSTFEGSGQAIVILSLVVVAQTVLGVYMLYHLLRQHGRVLNRLDALEAKVGIAAEEPAAGLPVGTKAPSFRVTDLVGATVTLDSLRASGKPILLLFSEPGCGVCDTILPEVASWQREHAERLTIVPISRGDADVNREKSKTHNVTGLLLQRDREVATQYKVENTPSAVLVRDGQIASALAVGPDAIRALVREAAKPPPLKRGERVSSLELRDLSGGSMDLANLRGARTMLLFWNPSCGFCASMLDDVKAWESTRPKDAPQLVVLSAGSPKANREQGFKSRVLLDPTFAALARFGADGTPSAVIVDTEGRVASDVGVGADAVWALAGRRVAETAG